MENHGDLCPPENHSIDILNFSEGQEVCYSVVVLVGKVSSIVSCESDDKVEVQRINGPWHTPASHGYDVLPNSKFKFILRLEHGSNTFLFKYCSVQRGFSLKFRPRRTPYCVLPVYVICKGHDGRFQAPEHEDNSIDSACDRIDTGLRLLQSLIAERLYIGGYGRETFQLQTDTDPMAPDCHVFYSNVTVEEAYTIHPKTLWAILGRELMQSHLGKETHKFVAFISCTHYEGKKFDKVNPSYEDILACTKGHAALGGGGLALFGSACLYTWACSVEEVVPRFLCNNPVDSLLFMNDSHHRGTCGGCFATTLGAVCHELGHTFDLGHTNCGIMGPEYHDIQYLFLPEEEDVRNRTVYFADEAEYTEEEPAMLVQDLRVSWRGAPAPALASAPAPAPAPDPAPPCGTSISDSEFHAPQTTQQNLNDRTKTAGILMQDLKVDWNYPERTSPHFHENKKSADVLKQDLTVGWNCPENNFTHVPHFNEKDKNTAEILMQDPEEDWISPDQTITYDTKQFEETDENNQTEMLLQDLNIYQDSSDEPNTFTLGPTTLNNDTPSDDCNLPCNSDYLPPDLQPVDLTSFHSTKSDEQNAKLSPTSKRACIDENENNQSGNDQTDAEEYFPDCFDPMYDDHDKSPFLPESCLAILAYNKWISTRLIFERNGTITFDRKRKQILSNLGMRVVDLRDEESKSVLHWKFFQSAGLTKFSIPENLLFTNLRTIVVVDSAGNVLKDSLVEPSEPSTPIDYK